MYFEAQLQDRNYKINVDEEGTFWKISLLAEGKDWVHYEISKKDYTKAEDYISFLFNGKSYLVDVVGQDTEYMVYARNSFRTINIYNDEMLLHRSFKNQDGLGSSAELKTGMPGKIIEIFVKPGQKVPAGKPLLIMEAMKMENEMRAPADVTISEICVRQGDSVESGAVLIKFEKQ